MKLKTVVFLMALSFLCSLVKANEISHRSAAEKLLLLTNTDKILKPIGEQIEDMMKQRFVQIGATEELKPVLKRYITKMLNIMDEELGWAEMKNDYIDIYVKTYTEKEIYEISEFYKSPVGRKYIEKMPELIKKSMVISQKKMPTFMKRIEKITQEMINEIKQLNEKKKAVKDIERLVSSNSYK